mgnify:CR=1 FL=1
MGRLKGGGKRGGFVLDNRWLMVILKTGGTQEKRDAQADVETAAGKTGGQKHSC